jgi:metal-responsive CopG/Arc/MetJ family transcriptional regulator
VANIKTAISLPESLFEQAEALARDQNISRSRLFVLALENFIREYEDRKLFEQINKAYAEQSPDEVEQLRLAQSLRQHRRLLEGEW